jgi:hypothetical protein
VKTDNTDNMAASLTVNQVKIEFTDKPLTAWGGLATLLGKFIEKIHFREWVEENVPIEEKSNNSGGIYEKVLSQFITVLSGGSRFSHLHWWSHGKEAFQKVFKIKWLPSASSTLTRFWNKISTQKVSEQLGEACRKFTRVIVRDWEGIKEDNLNFDSSVITRYGLQEGAKRGYNPKKRGRPSHHPIIAFLGESGYVVNFWNRSGNATSAEGIIDFFEQTVLNLGVNFNVKRVLGDSGLYLAEFLDYLESKGYTYIISAPMLEILQKEIYRIKDWQQIAEGIEVAEFYFEHYDKKWTHPRRYVVVRQQTQTRPNASGKQPSLFKELEELKDYRYSLMITNDEQLDSEQVWHEYRSRAKDENCIKDLKEGYNVDTFNLNNFWSTEAVLTMITLVFYNLIHFLNRKIINIVPPFEQLKTLRLKYFIIPGELGSSGRYSILRLGIGGGKLREGLQNMLRNIHNFSKTLNCNAVEPVIGDT